MSRVHPFSFFVAPKEKNRALKMHQRRDLGAAMELMDTLRELGFEQGEAILNFPPANAGATGPLLKVDLSFVAPGDFLLQTTRPPLDDLRQGARKKVGQGFTDVEAWTLDVWRHYFDTCARLNLALAPGIGKRLPQQYANRRGIEFQERIGAPYKRMNPMDGSRNRKAPADPRTAAFFLRLEEAWRGGPGLMAAFGMDGTSTLVWAYRLARDYRHLLARPGFTMVEMAFDAVPERPTDLLWADDWKIEVLMESVPSTARSLR